ncbi:hypothetical protein [uncultured Kordia sp.]|uniref:hypothetical protein n=1 Tax=uncultured Kordia sp. TaxID=507699 RepID=UPI0026031773|nr:hypothetical protein [uncultured Kordia sp.]
MMLLDLICFDCLMEQVNKGEPNVFDGTSIPTPFEQVNNDGIYEVNCAKGHKSKTIIDNINFEILFEYGLNAIVDGYYREAVSSITSAMERYFEFFIKTILRNTTTDFDSISKVWKKVSSQSERQLGAYIMLYFQAFSKEPLLLNQNKEVPFRNSVIHKGYIPTKDEAVNYGNSVMNIIEQSLIDLKQKFPKETELTFEHYGYKKKAEEEFKKIEKDTGIEQNFACVNIMTTIDVKHGREINPKDGRKGMVEDRIVSILKRREPRRLTLLKDKPKEK